MDPDLQKLMAAHNKQHGADSFFMLSEGGGRYDRQRLSTGIPTVDFALGGGFVPGRIAELYGPESGGKSLLAYTTMAEVQRHGGQVVLFDTELSSHPDYMRNCGLDPERVIISQHAIAEDVYRMVDDFARTGKVRLIVLDSMAALQTKSERDAGPEAQTYAALANVNSRLLKWVAEGLYLGKTAFLIINQQREVINAKPFQEKWRQPGGMALKYAAAQRIEVRRIGDLEQGKEVVGLETGIFVKKNKTAPPRRKAQFRTWFYNGIGVDRAYALAQLAIQFGLVRKRGSWLSDGTQNWQGMQRLADALRNEPELHAELTGKVSAMLDQGVEPAALEGEDADAD